jgi:hypothetical protein
MKQMIKERLRKVQIFSQRFTSTKTFLADHPTMLFVKYDDYRFLERQYEELLKRKR